MASLSLLPIQHPFIALFGSGNSISNLSEKDLRTIKAHAFTITLNYAPIHLKGDLNIWSDRKVSDFLEGYYANRPKDSLFMAQQNRTTANFKKKIDYWFDRKKEGLQGNYTIVWVLQLLRKYFPEKTILLFGVDLYTTPEAPAKWYDNYTDYDRKKRGQNYRVQDKLNQCGAQLSQFIPRANIFNCNLNSRLKHFKKKDWAAIFHLKILHLCPTSLAGAPLHLSKIINKYTLCESRSILRSEFVSKGINKLRWNYDIVKPSNGQLREAIDWADLIHHHRSIYPYEIKNKPSLLQFHSPPNGYKAGRSYSAYNGRKLVIAQYHPRFYTDAQIVPNLIDIWEKRLQPEEKSTSAIHIFYSWAFEKKGTWSDKGSQETLAILKKIKHKYEDRVAITVIHNQPYERCIAAKRKAHICIDECITGSYHLQSLEGCSLGALTLNNVDDETLQFMKMASGVSTHPFVKSSIHTLYETLCFYIEHPEQLEERRYAARKWMEENWDPQKLVFCFVHTYFKVFNNIKLCSTVTPNDAVIVNKSKTITPKKQERPSNRLLPKLAIRKKVVEASRYNPTKNHQSLLFDKGVNGKSIRELYRKFDGQDIYIFGSGPSILQVNPEDFRNKICFGINYTFEKMPFMDYLLVHEIETYESIKLAVDNNILLLPETLVRHHFGDDRDKNKPHRIPAKNPEAYIYPIQDPYEKRLQAKTLSLEEQEDIFTWSTTTHSAIHIAAYMGAKHIFLIGVDYRLFPNGNLHFQSKYSTIYNQQKWNANAKHRQGDQWLEQQLKLKGIILENISKDFQNGSVSIVHQSPQPLEYSGRYCQGIGKAHKVAATQERKALLKRWFGCGLIGTFNIKTNGNAGTVLPNIQDGIHRFNLVKISLSDGRYQYGWSYRFVGSKQKDNILEIYTKKLLPEDFKAQSLNVSFFDKWSESKILNWQRGKYWFQGFDWLPAKRADSQMLWKYIRVEDFENKSVLDFGTHYGYFAFQASKQGALVEAIDKISNNIAMAKTINEHIEQQDVQFNIGDTLPDKTYDYIFELSVYHWIDEDYEKLTQHIEELKKRCKILFLELINPPLKGQLSIQEVDQLVNGKKLIHYQHRVRRTRTLYKVKGYL